MSTYTPIASFTLSSAQSTVSLSNIPSIYTDLILVAKFDRSAADTGSWFRINNDSGSNYSTTEIRGNGSNATSGRDTNVTVGRYFRGLSNQTTDNFFTMNLMNYSNTSIFKTILTRGGVTPGTGSGTEANVNLWRSTAAITEINLITASGTYSAGSTFNLYGIANAGLTAKATGGDIVTTDGTYWYHTFTSSGTFTPTQSLTADYLVVAGGGAGGNGGEGGGGGAGGMRCTVTGTGGSGSLESPLSLAANTGYTVTIGAGGAPVSGNNGGNGSNSVFATITSTGGGGGGKEQGTSTDGDGQAGGSGGGGGNRWIYNPTVGGAASPSGQGFAGGGSAVDSHNAGAGGGGASQAGADTGNAIGGKGGDGRATSISGSSVTYAGGGGGGVRSSTGTRGAGGAGGGGAGGKDTTQPEAGTANTGGGGGGADNSIPNDAKSGGSGIVIVRYAV